MATIRPSVGRAFSNGSRLELELPGTRQLFDDYIDDFWEANAKLSWIKPFGRKAELSFSYQFGQRLHDTREVRDAQGRVEPGEGLVFYEHEITAAWRQYWDVDRRWRTTTKLTLQRNEDNGGGYYDYWRPYLSEQLRYQSKAWELRAEARVSYYNYDRQRIDGAESDLRTKTYVRFGLRAERKLTKSVKLFGLYEHERALSNLSFDRYTVNTISGGVAWEY